MEENTGKLTYEKLESVAINMQSEIKRLNDELSQIKSQERFIMMDYLFKIVEMRESFMKDDKDIVSDSISIIRKMMIPSTDNK